MKLKLTLLTFIVCCFSAIAIGQKKYNGTLFTKLGQEIKGEIKLNLEDGNDELIEITTVEKTKGKGSKQTLTTSIKLNVAIIDHVLVGGKTYYFRDIKIDYDDKYVRNVCVQLIYGTITSGIFQSGDGTAKHSIGIKFPKESLYSLASVDFEYYNSSASVAMRISNCKPLLDKMMNEDKTVTWKEDATREQRIQCFKNIISDYNKCNVHED
ncbi:MAG: hypothetical protein ABIP79_17740 [Chitinophagaceae bacterium]